MDKIFLRDSGKTRFFIKILAVLSFLAYLLVLTGLFKTLFSGRKETEILTLASALTVDVGDREKLLKVSGSGFDDRVRASLSFDTGNYRALVGSLKTWGHLNQVVVREDRVFLANGKRGLQVVDVADPQKPRIIGSVDTPGFAWGVRVHGDHAFVADGPTGLVVISIADPARLRILSTTATRGDAYAVDFLNGFVLVADQYGIAAVSVDHPQHPESMFLLDLPQGKRRHLRVKGKRIYLTNGKNGVAIIDFDRVSGLRLVDTLKTRGPAERVTISGNTLLVGCGKQGVDLFALKDTKVEFVEGIDTPGFARGIAVVGNRIFVAVNTFGLQVLETEPGGVPIRKKIIETPHLAWDVVSGNGLLYVAQSRGGLQIIDPARAREASLPTLETGGSALELVSSANRLYLADGHEGVRFIDIDSDGRMTAGSTIDTPGYVRRLKLFNERLYLADRRGGLVIVGDLQGKGHVENIVPLPGKVAAESITVSPRLACVGVKNDGLFVIDIADPGRPQIVGSLFGLGNVRDVSLVGDQLYVAADERGLLQVSLKNPARPLLLGEVEIPSHLRVFSTAVALSQSEDLLLLANSRAGCQIFDVSHPHRPNLLSTVSAMGNIAWAKVVERLAFIYDNDRGLLVVDLTEPEKPYELGTLGVTSARSVDVVGNQACVTFTGGGVKCMPLPMEMTLAAISDSGSIYLRIPPLPVSGNYLLSVSRDGQYAIMDEPMSFRVAGQE
ncbi:MAG: hypothetical protein R2940_11705 [Syntrophotaleaceae bacterium]